MATLTLGKVRPVPKGAWSSSVTYEAYDWVTYKESAWLALVDVPKNYEPDSHPTVWVKFGAQGEQGEQGIQGIQGEKGEKGEKATPRHNSQLCGKDDGVYTLHIDALRHGFVGCGSYSDV